ncbi:Ubiquitin carboxyl-terminal hydrolase 2 [Choanephora cucurbitarum]|uniref:ubiquitinyl hydrolase 1 n=1 Tax=Choanephora cucurbitarum TaxID=101091 RepID=A0A1C7N2A9_9FUNG|nr:Ubiquitin carboxyl-terminal hydrolase 2 [Choanephora cucurbitarum]
MSDNIAPELPSRHATVAGSKTLVECPCYSPLALLVHFETFQSDHQHTFKTFYTPSTAIEEDDDESLTERFSCQTCHSWLIVQRTTSKGSQCTGPDYPCHHFHSQGRENYQCCGCGYSLAAEMQPPALPIDVLKRLETTRPKARSFADSAQQKEASPTVESTYSTILIYVNDLINGTRRSINSANRAFLERIGFNDISQILLEVVGFQLVDGHFVPPEVQPNSPEEERLYQIRHELVLSLDTLRQQLGSTSVPQLHDNINIKVKTANMQPLLGLVTSLETRYTTDDAYIRKAYNRFGLTPGASDTLVSWIYKRLLNEPTISVDSYDAMDDLTTIANHTSSVTLQTLVAIERSQGKIGKNDISDAYAYFDAPVDTPDDLLIGLYQVKITDEPFERNKHQDKLTTIAIARQSAELIEFLKQQKGVSSLCAENAIGIPSHMINSQRQVPVGLNNIGNTCYFNSLLQYYYTIVPFRETMIHNENYVEDEYSEPKKIGGIKVDLSEIRRAKRFVTLLKELFCNIQRCKERAISPQYDLAYMALLNEKDDSIQEEESKKPAEEGPSQLVEQDDINDGSEMNVGDDIQNAKDSEAVDTEMMEAIRDDSDIQATVTEVPVKDEDISLEAPPSYESIVSEEKLKQPLVDAKKPEQKERPNVDSMMFGRQQDVTECMGNVMYLVEAALKPLSKTEDGEQVDDMIRQTFYGKARQILSYRDNTTLQTVKKEQEEDFSHIIVDAKEGKNLYDIMDEYFFANQVDFQGGHEATREVTVKSFPPILQVLVQRVQFDRATVNVYKSNAYVQFDKTIYLDRYIEDNFEELKDKRAQVAAWRAELDTVTQEVKKYTHSDICKMPIPDLLDATRQVLEDFLRDNSEETQEKQEQFRDALELLNKEAEEKRALIEEGNQRIAELKKSIETQYKDHTKVAYNLHAVFIHQGQANYGHYWIYILDHVKNQWWKYNDSLVTKVNESEIFHDTTGSTANPYFLVYVDANRTQEYVETIPAALDDVANAA